MASRPPPPEPYETWLDSVLDGHIPESPYGRARAELAELREANKRMLAFCDSIIAPKSVTAPPTQVITMPLSVATNNPPDPADEYLRTAMAAIDAAKETQCESR